MESKYTIATGMNHFYLRAAYAQAERAAEMAKSGNKWVEDVNPLAAAAVIFATSYLEIAVNVVFTETNTRTKFGKALQSVWSDGFERQRTLSKYQVALVLAGRSCFDTGREPYASAQDLIELRNYIAHPKDMWGIGKGEAKLKATLRRRYTFVPDDLRPNHAFFPTVCLSPQCAAWATAAAAEFVEEFYKNLPSSARSPFYDTAGTLGKQARALM